LANSDVDYVVKWEEDLRRETWAPPHEDVAAFLYTCRYKVILDLLENYDQVIHVGADVYFTGDIREWLDAQPLTVSCFLSPHILRPNPDRCIYSYLRTGVFNSDFQVYRAGHASVKSFLSFMFESLTRESVADIRAGKFFDQRLLDLAPVFIKKMKVIRHPGINVAYYNLHERSVEKIKKGKYVVNDNWPLYCFQFTGYDPKERPSRLTKYINSSALKISIGTLLLMKEFYEKYIDNFTSSR